MQISTIVLSRLLRRREVGISAAAPKPTEKSHSRARPFSDSRLAPAAGTCRHSSRGAPPGTDRRVTPGPLAPSAWWREARCWLLRVSVFPFLKWAQELEILSHGAGDRDRRVLLPLGMSMPPSPPGQARPVDPPPGQVQGNAAAPAARALGPPASQRAALPLGRPRLGGTSGRSQLPPHQALPEHRPAGKAWDWDVLSLLRLVCGVQFRIDAAYGHFIGLCAAL